MISRQEHPQEFIRFIIKSAKKLNPLNCSEADIIINVAAPLINANNDFANGINGYSGANNVVNILGNDALNGSPVSFLQVNIHSISTTTP
ncbi:hypothetical protein AB9T88_11735, partial [Flavobacterium sp. LBUM151]